MALTCRTTCAGRGYATEPCKLTLSQPAVRWLPSSQPRGHKTSRVASSSSPGAPTIADLSSLPGPLLMKQSIAMFASGAVLGPLCDGLHSSHNILHYNHPTVLSLPSLHWSLETCWWVPLLFGVAGVILGVRYPVLDLVIDQKPNPSTPSNSSLSECLCT